MKSALKVAWRWLAFSTRGAARPVYHAVKPTPPGAVHDANWDRACESASTETEVDPDGREWCLGCKRKVYGPQYARPEAA